MFTKAVEITKDNFESKVLKAERPVIIDLWAEWCMPCKMIVPTLDEIANDYRGEIDIAKINVDEYPGLATDLSVMNIPALIFLGNKYKRILINKKKIYGFG